MDILCDEVAKFDEWDDCISKEDCFGSHFPKMLDFEEEMFVDHLDQIFTTCWKHYDYLQKFCLANCVDFQMQSDNLIEADF